MLLQASTQEEFPDVGSALNRSTELRIHQRMFSGQPVIDPDGNLVPAVSAISFQTFEQQATWQISQPDGPFPDSQFTLYDVTILLDRPGFSTLKVEGQIKFYVSERDSLHEGVNRRYFEMIGQQDLTNSGLKATEQVSWGSVKALYR